MLKTQDMLKSKQELREKKARIKEKLAIRALKKREKRENKLSTLENKADKLWSLVVRKPGVCAVCGKQGGKLDPHHIFSRANHSVRWDIENGICLCSGCHTLSSKFSAHLTPCEFTYWLERQYSREWVEELGRKARTPRHIDAEYLKATIIYLKSQLGTSTN